MLVEYVNVRPGAKLTVSEDELGDSGNVHSNCAQEVVISIETVQTVWGGRTLKSAETQDGGCVRDQESEQTQKGRVCEALGEVTTRWCIGLEEQAFVLLWAQSHGHLTAERRATATIVVGLASLGHDVV